MQTELPVSTCGLHPTLYILPRMVPRKVWEIGEALTAYCVKPASRCEALMLRARCDIPDKEDLVMALRQLLNFDRTAVAIFRKMPTRGIDFAAGQRHA